MSDYFVGNDLEVTFRFKDRSTGDIIPLQSASVMLIKVKAEDPATTTSHSASFVTDGSDGKIFKNISLDGPPGDWIIQPYIELPSTGSFDGPMVYLTVRNPL